MQTSLIALTLLFFSFNSPLFSEDYFIDPSTQKSFPNEIVLDYEGAPHVLYATGVSTRVKFFIKIYSIAYYTDKPPYGTREEIFSSILTPNKFIKQLNMKWLYDVTPDKIQTAYQETFKSILTPEQFKALQAPINSFISLYTEPAKTGDEHILRWLPNGEIVLVINGKEKGSVLNKDFAPALWSVWFGPKAVVSRSRLVAFLKE